MEEMKLKSCKCLGTGFDSKLKFGVNTASQSSSAENPLSEEAKLLEGVYVSLVSFN